MVVGHPSPGEDVHLFFGHWYYGGELLHIVLELSLHTEEGMRKLDRVDNCDAVVHRHRFSAQMDPRDNDGEIERLYQQQPHMDNELQQTFGHYRDLYVETWPELLRRWR